MFSLNTSYHSVEHDDESCGDNEDLLQESKQQAMVFPSLYTTKLSSPEHPEFFSKEDEPCISTPDSFFDLIDGRNFDFASTPIDDPFTIETAPIVAGGRNTKETTSDGLTRQAQRKQKQRHSSLCEWPEDNMNDDLVEEVWQESDAQPNGVAHPLTRGNSSSPPKAPTPEYVVTGSIELKTADQPSGITFQKTDDICPLKIQGFSPFSHFKTKTNLKPGMVVLEINGREMTWESTKEAVAEIKKAKPGKVTILAIAPSKITSAPKALADRITTPPIKAKTKKDETISRPATSVPAPVATTKISELPKPVEKKETEAKSPVKTHEDDATTHYRDPSLMMVESTITETTEADDTHSDVKVSTGPSFKQLNPSFMRVDSAVTTDTGISPNSRTKNGATSPKSKPAVSLLGHIDDDVEMDVVYVGESESYPDEEDEVLPTAKFSLPSSPKPMENPSTPKQSNTTASTMFGANNNTNTNTSTNTKPPLPYRNGTRATKQSPEDPPSTRKPSVEEPSTISSSSKEAQTKKSEENNTDAGEEAEETIPGIFCNGMGINVSPMLTTMKDISNFANRFTERMPSWMRVLCHE